MLTDDEIRLKIAELKGWTLYDPAKYNGQVFGTAPEGQFYAQPPMWATDISAAWGLVEEMRADGWLVIVKTWPPNHVNPISGSTGTASVNLINKAEMRVWCSADTVARAICLVYLKLKGMSNETKNC